MTSFPSIQRRTPSSLVVWKVYDSLRGATSVPLQRTENVSGAMDDAGEPEPQLKSIFASVRVSLRAVKSLLSKYWAVRPVSASSTRDSRVSINFMMRTVPAECARATVAFRDKSILAPGARETAQSGGISESNQRADPRRDG